MPMPKSKRQFAKIAKMNLFNIEVKNIVPILAILNIGANIQKKVAMLSISL
jgi:hypothetical protein